MIMLLCIDIGNTNIKFGLFDQMGIHKHWRIATNRANLSDEYAVLIINLFKIEDINITDVTACAISSVVPPLTEVFVNLSIRYF